MFRTMHWTKKWAHFIRLANHSNRVVYFNQLLWRFCNHEIHMCWFIKKLKYRCNEDFAFFLHMIDMHLLACIISVEHIFIWSNYFFPTPELIITSWNYTFVWLFPISPLVTKAPWSRDCVYHTCVYVIIFLVRASFVGVWSM